MNDFHISAILKDKPIHFIGIGGISMSGLAQICIKEGFMVSGSDMNESEITKKLASLGARVFIGHNSKNCEGAGLVVYTAAIKNDNPELVYARENGITSLERSVFLGAVMREYKNSVCVSGTHGKTTTTSMMSYVMLENDLDPTIMLGGELDLIGGNFRLGESSFFLAESCEYHRSFLEFFPRYAIITNVDEDHLDYFKDIDDIKKAFSDFAALVDKDGCVIVCGDDKNALDCAASARSKIITYGIDIKNDVHPSKLFYDAQKGRFSLTVDGCEYSCALNIVGEHNVRNALGCIACAYVMRLDIQKTISAVERFSMVHRRFEKKGEINGALVYDDYAHHPTEIDCTLKTAAQIAKNKVIVAFQPHTYTRTYNLIDEFEKAFDAADEIIVTDIYAAREKDTGLIHASELSGRLSKRGKDAKYIKDFNDIAGHIKNEVKEGDIVITMGAGNIYTVGDILLKDE